MNVAFGKHPPGATLAVQSRSMAGAAPAQHAAHDRNWIAWLALILLGAGTAFYAWRVILEVPWERPLALLFSDQRQQVGWAPWWVAPLLAAVVSGLITSALVRRPGRLSPRSVMMRALLAAYAGLVCAGLTRNLGYMLLFVPGATWVNAIVVLPQMAAMHLLGSVGHLTTAQGLPIVAAAMTVAIALSLVCHPAWVAADGNPLQFVAAMREQARHGSANGDIMLVSPYTRTISSVAFGVLVSLPALFVTGPFVVVPMIVNACVWHRLALPDRHFDLARALFVGTASAALLNALAFRRLGWDLAGLVGLVGQALLLTAIVAWRVRKRAVRADLPKPDSSAVSARR
ncbi:MAG: hypothetical protein C5B56_09175 [Proteobacteria bacterium]|nr:MAG: hypothetical protein C5B56_09175 [Pseudomonadota bacterium]